MSIETSVLIQMKSRIGFNAVYNRLPKRSLTTQTLAIVEDIAKYYDLFPDVDNLNFEQFKHLFFLKWHKSLDKDQKDYYNILLNKIDTAQDFIDSQLMAKSLTDMYVAEQMEIALDKYNNDEEIDIEAALYTVVEEIEKEKLLTKATYKGDDLEKLLSTEELGKGFSWANQALNETLAPILLGDNFIIIAARPGAGKTTFVLQQLISMVSQIDDRPILYLNNEATRTRIVKRAVQVALKATRSDLMKLSKDGALVDTYEKAIKTKADKLRVLDIHGYTNIQVEELIKQHNPKVVVVDMLDNVNFLGMPTGARTDQQLEKMYIFLRELGVKYDLVPIATSQLSMDAEGLAYPTQAMLKDSKTGKAGAADTIIMLGMSDDPLRINSRYVSVAKTKSKLENAVLPRAEFLFNSDTGEFVGATK